METPFKFLEAYGKADRRYFFGRDEEIASLYSLVRKTNLVIVYGKSGVGKTSIVKCGLANEFAENEIKSVEIRRRSEINGSFEQELLQCLKMKTADGKTPAELVEKLYNRHLSPVYLFFDQFEELFILGDAEEIEKFISNIKAIRALEIPCVITLIIRQEYLAELEVFREEVPMLFEYRLPIAQMDRVKTISVVNNIFKKLQEENYLARIDEQKILPIKYDTAITPEIVNIVSNGNFFIELPYLQVYLDKMFRVACEKATETVEFNYALLEDDRISCIETVINNLLDTQILRASKATGEDSDLKVLAFLKILVTDLDTKKPVHSSILFSNSYKNGISEKEVEIYIDIFSKALLLRPLDGNQYELSHDSVAKAISEKRSTARRMKPLIDGNPYKGLESFTDSDADVKRYFGRSEAIEKVMSIIKTQKLIVVSGLSGTGKSSLVKAGIFPVLNDMGYDKYIIRAGIDPLGQLENVLTAIRKSSGKRTGHLILIDQYEELITRRRSGEETDNFTKKILQVIEDPKQVIPKLGELETIKIMITIRADFEPQFKSGLLEKYWDKGRYVVPYMTTRELEQAIENPADLAACYFEPPSLIRNIAEEVSGRPSSLPLLSFALSLMYEKSLPGRIITKDIYDKTGVFGALQTKANEIYFSFPEETKRTMQQVLLRMVSLEGSEIASRRVFLDELHYGTPEENYRVNAVLDTLVRERLVIKKQDESRGNLKTTNAKAYVEPAHDALLKGWTRLWDWIKDFGKENILLRERLNAAIVEWETNDRTVDALWSDNKRIYEIKDLRNSENNWLNEKETEFVNASRIEWVYTKRKFYIVMTVLIVFFAGLAVWGIYNYRLASTNEKIAKANELQEKKTAQFAFSQLDTAIKSRQLADSALWVAAKQTAEAKKNLDSAMAEKARTKIAMAQLKKQRDQTAIQRNLALLNRQQLADSVLKLTSIRDSLGIAYSKSLASEKLATTRAEAIAKLNDSLLIKSEALALSLKNLRSANRSLDSSLDAISVKSDSIRTLSILVPYLEVARTSQMVKNYQDILSRQNGYRALWPADYKLKLGDVGKFYNGEFKVETNLRDLSLPFDIKTSQSNIPDYEFTHGDIKTDWQADTCKLKFAANSFHIQLTDVILRQIANLDNIAKYVNDLYRSGQGKWDPAWLIVTDLMETKDGHIIVAPTDSKKASNLTISVNNTVNKGSHFLPTNFTILKIDDGIVVFPKNPGTFTPLFKAQGLRNTGKK